MSLNRTLVGGAGAVLSGLGTHRVLISTLPDRCQQAIIAQMPDNVIVQACPPGFDNTWLLGIILVGGAAFVLINFGRDIAGFVEEKLSSNSN